MPRKPDTEKKNRYNDSFPTALRTLIDEHGTKQDDLKKVLGLKNRQSVTGYIDGETQPTPERIVAVAKYYGVSTDWLLGLSSVRNPDKSMQGAATVTGLSEEALNNVIKYFRGTVAPESQAGFGGAEALSDLSPLLENQEFIRLIPDLVSFCFIRNICAEILKHWTGKDYGYVNAFIDESDRVYAESLFPEDRTEEFHDIAFENFKKYFPEMRMQKFELLDNWSDFLESFTQLKELESDGKEFYQDYMG